MFSRLAWRNIWRNRRRTLVIMTAVVIGVWSMVFLGAFMRGMFHNMLENGKSILTGDIQIHHRDYQQDPSIVNSMHDSEEIEKALKEVLPEKSKWAGRIRVSAIMDNARHSAGVTLVGIDPSREKGVSFIASADLKGEGIERDDRTGILVGRALVEDFETGPGRKLILTTRSLDGEISAMAFRVKGVFQARMESTEKRFAFVSIRAARELVKMQEGISEIAVTLGRDADADVDAVAARLENGLGGKGVSVNTWKEILPMLQAYAEMFDGFMLIWYVVVFAAMGFGIVNTFLMSVYERIREFGLMRALGMGPMGIVWSVLTESVFLICISIAVGNFFGWLCVNLMSRTGLDLSVFGSGTEFFGVSRVVYPELAAADLLKADITVLVLGVLVSLYPAVKAARITPVEAMHHY